MGRKPTLATLYTPPTTPDLDVVLVHGLGGDTTQTWTWRPEAGSPKSSVCWPQELLPAARPLTRILSYGYNADIHNNRSIASIRDHSRTILERLIARRHDVHTKRPIVFIGHCLGGLIVKQVLRFAEIEREKYGSIATATCGILLFGTPHFGNAKEQVRAIAERFAPMAQTDEQPEFGGLTRAILANSNDLKEISEDFKNLAPRYSITSWYETECWPGTDRPIVDAFSARMQIPDETQLSVAADHLAMCQFEDADDGTFQEVCERIQKAVETGYRGPSKADWDKETANVDVRDAVFVPQTQRARPTHKTADGTMVPKIVVRAMEIEYHGSPSMMGDPVQMLNGAGRGEPVLLLEDADDTNNKVPWRDEATMPAAPVRQDESKASDGVRRAAKFADAFRGFRRSLTCRDVKGGS